MPRGDRGNIAPIVVAIIGIAAFSLFVGAIWALATIKERGENDARYAARDYAKAADEQIRERCLGLPPVDQLVCVTEQVKSARESQRGEYDLKAQEAVAIGTFFMVGIASLGLLLSVVGVGLVFITFKETRRSADAAEKAISEATRIGEAQVKSYMTVTKGFIRLGGDGTVSVRLEVKNSGQSPARSVRFESWTTLAPLSGEIQQQFRTTVEDLAMPVASQMKAKLPPQTAPDKMKKEILDALIDGKPVAVTLTVMLHWRDVFRGKPTQGASFSTIISEWMIDEYQELPFAEHMIAAFRHETIRRGRDDEESGERA